MKKGSDPSSTLRRRLVITGRVQGVWFRGSMQRKAREFGVAGWVRNRGDGSVEAVLEGTGNSVDRLTDWSASGPSGSRVLDVESQEELPEGLQGFCIRQ